MFHFGVLAPLALVGAWVTRREWRRLWLLYLLLLSMAGAVALFYVLARYRFPMVPILALFAAAGLLELVRLVRQAEWRRLARIGLLISIPAIGCNWSLRGSVDPRTITYYSLGSALIEQGRFTEGQDQLDKALTLDPDFGNARYKLGDSMLKQGKPFEALRYFERTIQRDTRHADAHTGLGMALLMLGDPARAASHFETAIELKPEDAAAHNNLASALAQQGRIVEATSHLEHAVRAKPDDADLRANLGKVLLAQGDPVRARAQFEHALGLVPDHAEARQGLDLALQQLQEDLD